VLFVTTLYCPPKSAGKKREEVTEHPAGLFPELAALGIPNGSSPALQATVARIVALSSSIEVAWKELRRQGVSQTVSVLARIIHDHACSRGKLFCGRRLALFYLSRRAGSETAVFWRRKIVPPSRRSRVGVGRLFRLGDQAFRHERQRSV
jgi:hypothetical protein